MNRQSGGSVELLLVLFISLLLFTGTIMWGLLPAMQEERSSQDRLERLKTETAALQKEYGMLFEEKQRFSVRDAKADAAMHTPPPLEKVEAWLHGFIVSATVEPMPNGQMRVSGNVDSPVKLYRVFDALNNEPWSLRVTLPLRMEKTEQGISVSWVFAPVNEGARH